MRLIHRSLEIANLLVIQCPASHSQYQYNNHACWLTDRMRNAKNGVLYAHTLFTGQREREKESERVRKREREM